MSRTTFLAVAALLTLAACDAFDRVRGGNDAAEPVVSGNAGPLTLGLHTPGAVAPGEAGTIRVSLANRGDTVAHAMHVELFVPEWMEPMPPQVGEPEVTMAAFDEAHTRLTYRMRDSLAAGETFTLHQRIRAAPADAAGATTWSRVVRARLVSPNGHPLAEIESEVDVAGAAGADTAARTAAAPAGAAQPRDRLGPVRLGMTAAALRQAAAGARDTTWQQEGSQERGIVVPVDGSSRALAVLAGDTVSRIEVRDPQPRTAEGAGVGTRLSELRSAYGRACAAVGEGIVVVWFPAAPGISFALDTPIPGDLTQLRDDARGLPADARVTRWWIRGGADEC